jgi:hypothetical protein
MKNLSNFISRKGVICLVILMTLGFNHIPAYSAPYATRMNAEVKFIVYPDGMVRVSSEGIYSIEYSYPIVSSSFEVEMQFSKILDKYNILSNMTVTLPPDQAATFPFNATTATISMDCANNITTTTLDASLILCDSFSGIDFNSFPFNSTDLSFSGGYTNQQFNGTMTIHLVPGLTLGDIHLNFEGNFTQVTISDSIRVFYNCTLPITGFPELNEETLNAFLMMLNSTIPGTGPGSIYESTNGTLTCTTFDTIITPIDANSAEVSFLVVINGDLIRLLANLFMGGGFNVPLYPMDLYPLINATAYLIKNIEFSASYSKSAKTLIVHSMFVQNLTEYLATSAEILPDMYPPELKPYIQSLLNTTYISLYSSTEKISYSGGKVTYNGNYTISGDLNAQINYVKNVYVDMLNAINPGPSWVKNTIKSTNVDITNLKMNLSTNGTSQRWNFEDAVVMPPINHINASSFRLEDFFNITSTLPEGVPEPPTSNDVLKLIVQGGSNGTHTVTLHIDPNDPERVPEPDELGGNTMVWYNQSISKLKRLIFRVWEGKAETIYNPTSITLNNPYTINVKQEANCILTIHSISNPTSINIKNATVSDGALPGTYKLLGTCIQISSSENVTINATIRIYYTLEQLSALELDENTLRIFYFDTASNQWRDVTTQINKSEHYAEATINHLSLWALFGQKPLTSLWQEWWFLTTIAIIVIAVILIAGLYLLKRKQAKPK